MFNQMRATLFSVLSVIAIGCGSGGSELGGSGSYSQADLTGTWNGSISTRVVTMTVDSAGHSVAKGNAVEFDGDLVVESTGAVTGKATCWMTSGQYLVEAEGAWSLALGSDKNSLSGKLDCYDGSHYDMSVQLQRAGTSGGGGTGGTGAGGSGTGGAAGGTGGGGSLSDAVPLACTTVSDATSCTNGATPEIDLGGLDRTACREQCAVELGRLGLTAGCWIVARSGSCYCRSGILNLGSSFSGGSCTLTGGP